jgi:hypothetical protein
MSVGGISKPNFGQSARVVGNPEEGEQHNEAPEKRGFE